MSVDRVVSRFDRGKGIVAGTIRMQLDTILSNEAHLLKVRGGAGKLAAAMEFKEMLERGESLSPGQINYIDKIYGSVWKGAGYESFSANFKPKAGLRHPSNGK